MERCHLAPQSLLQVELCSCGLCCVRELSARRLPRALHVEETLQEVKLQDPRENNDAALSHGPPADVVVVGLEEEVIGPFPHPGKVVEPPHVEDVDLQFLNAVLQT